jgi:hypothetical protein
MKRPRHELTWRAIRRRWATTKEEVNNINGSIGNHHYKSPSAPLLENVINGDSQFSEILNDRDKQRSDSVIEFSVPPISNIPQSSHRQRDVSKEMYSLQAEIILSELRIILSHLAFISHHIQREEKQNQESEDWKFVAMVIDRLCLILFTLSMALFTGLTLFSAPNFLKLQ